MKVTLRFINKNVIMSFNKFPMEQIQLLLPSDGFVRLNGECYKVMQIVKSVDTHGVEYVASNDGCGVNLDINVYVTRITEDAFRLGTKSM